MALIPNGWRDRLTFQRAQEDPRLAGCRLAFSGLSEFAGSSCSAVNRSKIQGHDQLKPFPLSVAENLLGQEGEATTPNEVWLTDITYIPRGNVVVSRYPQVFSGTLVAIPF